MQYNQFSVNIRKGLEIYEYCVMKMSYKIVLKNKILCVIKKQMYKNETFLI